MATAFRPVGEFAKFTVGDVSTVVGDIVAISASDTVVRADATDSTKMPGIGFVKSITGSNCIVQLSYIIGITGVSAGDTYWIDPDNVGKITNSVPTTSGSILQKVGLGKASNKLLIRIESQTLTI